MNQYKIIINQNELDTYEDDIISLNYQIDDILDVTKRSTNYSKTITLPGTPFNNKFFKQIFDVNIDNITFNPLIKLPAIITIGDNSVMNGSLQLLNIVINQKNVEYEVVITGLLRNILLDITELSLRDIDLSEYNHIRTQDNIVNSWTYNIKTWGVDTQYGGPGTGYVYPYIINGNSSSIWNTLLIYDATPAVYVKTIMEKIFETAGYTYTSKFFDSEYYNKLIIPFTDEKIQVDDDELLLREAIVGVSGATSGLIEGYVSMTSSEILRGTPWYYNQPYSYDIPLLRESGQVGDIIFKDPSGQWGEYGGFTCQNQGFYDIDLNLKMVARYREGNGVYGFKWTGNGFFKYYYKVQVLRTDGSVQTLSTSTVPLEWQPSDEVDGPGFVGPSFIDITNPLEFASNIQNVFLGEGDQVVIFFAVRYPEDGMTWNIDGFAGNDVRLSMLLAESLGGEPSSLKITPSSNQDMGLQMVNMNQVLPDIKMKDFFLNIVKMFNLLILDNPDKENDLIIEPKDEFFKSKQKIRNWTLKLDNDSDVKITPMSELDAKLYHYKYASDNDYYNQEYFDDTKREYGELKLYVENDFSDTTNKMELIFAPTPDAQEGIDSRVAPCFFSKTDGVMKPKKVKPRILFYGGVKDLYVGSELYIKDNELQDEIDYTTSLVYPYCGMWDDPFSPQYDLGFDETDKIYWDTDIRPFYNLYEQFHATTFNAISDVNSRLMEAKFYLTPQDISSFDFRDIILIDNSYWRVVKIKNYNPVNSDKLTDVVLFKINDLNVFAPDQYQIPVSNGSCPTDMVRKRTLKGWINVSSSGQIVTEDCCNQVNGVWVQGVCYAYGVVGNPVDFNNGDGNVKPIKLTRSNISPISQKNGSTTSNKNNNTSLSTDVVLQGLLNYVDGGVKNSTIVGDKNYISPNVNNAMIVGDNNSIVPSSENITIFGNNNSIQNEELTGITSNVFIVGNNITATTSNTLYTDNIYMSSGSTINGIPISSLTGGTPQNLSQVLTVGNTTGSNWIEVDNGFGLESYDLPNDIVDRLYFDPQVLSFGTGIKSENTSTTIYSQTLHTPTSISLYADGNGSGVGLSLSSNYFSVGFDAITDPSSDLPTIEITDGGRSIQFVSNPSIGSSGINVNGDGINLFSSQELILQGNIGVFLPYIGSATPIINLGLSSAGEIVTGTTGGSSIFTGGTVAGATNFTGGLSATTLSATTYYNLPVSTNNLSTTLTNGNSTGANWIDVDSGYGLQGIYTASTITDTISIDPEVLANGTGIKSIDTTTTDYSYVNVTPTQIKLLQDDITNGQIRRITIEPSLISLVADASSIEINESSKTISITTEPYGALGASTNKISIGGSSNLVQNVISTETISTSDNTPTVIHTFQCSGSGAKSYKVRVIGNKIDYSKSYLGELFGLYNYYGGTVTLVGSLDLVEKKNFTTATSEIIITGTTIRIRVIGEAATDINWSVYVEMNDIQ